jgi:hypothetical protein
MKRSLKTQLLALLLALSFIPLIGGGTAAAVSAPTNSVTLTISGGNATALAACVNAVKNGDKVFQQNKCKNTAVAVGGDVILKNVKILVVQENDNDGDISHAANTVDITIQGGDATALAACVNAVKNGDKVFQQNKCKNKAIAIGGDVTLKNVRIILVQEN